MQHTALVCAPAGRDALILEQALSAAGIPCTLRPDAAALAAALQPDTLMIIVADYVLMRSGANVFRRFFAAQESWSDLPVLVLTDVATRLPRSAAGLLEQLGNVSLLPRPLKPESLALALQAARRARGLQFELRDKLQLLNVHAGELERRVDERTTALQRETRERRQVEAALNESRRRESLGYLTGGVAHDFNNLLQVIGGAAELLRALGAGNPAIQKPLDSIARATTQGARMTQQLLSFARRQPMQIERLELQKHLPEPDMLLRHSTGRGIALSIEVAPDTAPVATDLGQLEVALLNLAINARDAMPDGGAVRLTAYNVPADHARFGALVARGVPHVAIEMQDTGTGMNEQVANQAFEPFFTTKPPGKGTGLGLSQVDGFARQSGGRAFLDSRPGATTVSIVLPAAGDNAPPPQDERASADAAVALPPGLRVLCVEDDPEVAAVAQAIFTGLGCEVSMAARADEALQAELDGLDLLFTDVRMPGELDGIDLARQVRRSHPGLAIVVASGFIGDPARLDGLKAVFLQKPYSTATVAQAAQKALKGSV